MGEDIKTSEIVGVGDSLLATPSARSAVLAGCGCAAAGEGASLVRGIVALYNAGKTGYVALGGGALLRSGGMRDSLVLLIKPSIGPITERTVAEILRSACVRGYAVNAARVVNAGSVREEDVLGKHYPRHAAVATRGEQALNADEQTAVSAYLEPLDYSRNLVPQNRLAFSATGLMTGAGLSAEELAKSWAVAFGAGNVKKLGQGARAFRVGLVTLPREERVPASCRGVTVPAYNAFYPALAEDFAGADLPTVAVWLKRDPAASNAVTLQEMKDGFAGETDPKEAAVKHPDSLRARAFRNDPALDLAGREMTVRKNFIHLTAPEDMDAWAQKDGDYAEGEFHAWFPDLVLASVRGSAISTGASKE